MSLGRLAVAVKLAVLERQWDSLNDTLELAVGDQLREPVCEGLWLGEEDLLRLRLRLSLAEPVAVTVPGSDLVAETVRVAVPLSVGGVAEFRRLADADCVWLAVGGEMVKEWVDVRLEVRVLVRLAVWLV